MERPPTPEAKRRLPHLVAILCLAMPLILIGSAPSWWQGVVTNSSPSNDFAAVNQGQLKNIARAAMEELDEHFPGGAGPAIHDMVSSWPRNGPVPAGSSVNDFAPVNHGQLKNVARPFYTRLIAEGFLEGYPWEQPLMSGGMPRPEANDFAMANIGQVKQLFAFDIRAGGSESVLPDWYSLRHFDDTGMSRTLDSDLDGLSNGEEFELGTNPLAEDSDGDGHSDNDEKLQGTDPRDLNSKPQTPQDRDGDGVPDSIDVDANEKLLAYPRAPAPHYAILPISVPTANTNVGKPVAVNRTGQVLLQAQDSTQAAGYLYQISTGVMGELAPSHVEKSITNPQTQSVFYVSGWVEAVDLGDAPGAGPPLVAGRISALWDSSSNWASYDIGVTLPFAGAPPADMPVKDYGIGFHGVKCPIKIFGGAIKLQPVGKPVQGIEDHLPDWTTSERSPAWDGQPLPEINGMPWTAERHPEIMGANAEGCIVAYILDERTEYGGFNAQWHSGGAYYVRTPGGPWRKLLTASLPDQSSWSQVGRLPSATGEPGSGRRFVLLGGLDSGYPEWHVQKDDGTWKNLGVRHFDRLGPHGEEMEYPHQQGNYTNCRVTAANDAMLAAGMAQPVLQRDPQTGEPTQLGNPIPVLLMPVDIVAVFGHGSLPGKARLDNILSARAEWSSVGTDKSLFTIKGKPPGSQSGEKLWVVQTAMDEATLKTAIATAPYVAFDGHSNFGVGPAFDPASIRTLTDFTNLGNMRAGIDWPYLKQPSQFPNLETIPDAQIARNPRNYIVFPLRVNKLRYPNEGYYGDTLVGPGERFSLKAPLNGLKYHYSRRSNLQGSAWENYTIVDAGKADMPASSGYRCFFYNACDTARDYSEVFRKGYFFCSNKGISVSNEGTDAYVEAIIEGKTEEQILTIINETEPADPSVGEPAFRLVEGPL